MAKLSGAVPLIAGDELTGDDFGQTSTAQAYRTSM